MATGIAALLLLSRLSGAAACTAIAVDGGAAENGAAFATENTDCDNCDFRLTYVKAQDHPEGAQRPIYLQKAAYPRFVGYGRGEIYHPVGDQVAFKPALHIPQVEHTYGYYESACPLMNDKGLGIGESSCAANLLNRDPNAPKDNRSVPVGYLDAAALMQLVLERCATSRCAARTMGELVEAYGYLPFFGEPTLGDDGHGKSEWDDAGEAYALADASGEAWVVHVLGGVNGVIRSVWAAQRVPKGHVAPIANTYTIGELPDEPNEDFLFSKEIHRAARVAGLWDGKGKLHFSRVFGPDVITEQAPKGAIPIPLYTSLRKWRLLALAAPSAKLQLELDSQELPFSVKVDHKLTRRDIMNFMGDHYAGTEFDMTQGMLAGPWGSPFRAEGGPKKAGQVPRGISIMRSIYSAISESGPDGSRVWFGPDTAMTTVYMPLDARTDALVPGMHIGTYTHFTRESMFWAFDYVNNWMQLNYARMSAEDVEPRRQAWQDQMDKELAELQANPGATRQEVADWQLSVQQRVHADWWNLADKLVVKWNDMERTADGKVGAAWSYPEEWAKMIGMSNDVHPIWVQPASEPAPPPKGYEHSTVSLPRTWDVEAVEWKDWSVVPGQRFATQPEGMPSGLGAANALIMGVGLFLAGSFSGFVVGRRSPAKATAAQEPLLA